MTGLDIAIGAVIGGGAGLVSGMFGVGGGFIIVPLLVVVLGLSPAVAVGTALCATLANASGAFVRYAGLGAAEVRFDIMLLGGSLVGVTAGTYALSQLQMAGSVSFWGGMAIADLVLAGMYVVVFSSLAAIAFVKPSPERQLPVPLGPLARVRWPPMARLPRVGMPVSGSFVGVVGLLNGALSGMMGLGGGITLVPIMIYGFGFDVVRAAGTGILLLFVTTLAGTAQQAWLGNIDIYLALAIIASSGVTTQVGVKLTKTLPARVARKLLAAVMLLSALILLVKLLFL